MTPELAALNAAWAAHFDGANEEDASLTWEALQRAERVWAESLRHPREEQ